MSNLESRLNSGEPRQRWNDVDDAILRQAVTKPLSASQIAALFHPPKSRSAVIGRIQRLQLKLFSHGPIPSRAKLPQLHSVRASKSIPIRKRPIPAQASTLLIPQEGLTILQLSDQTCKWPIGDPFHNGFRYCGQEPRQGGPYCEIHSRQAYERARSKAYYKP